jgi:hypothetical protein
MILERHSSTGKRNRPAPEVWRGQRGRGNVGRPDGSSARIARSAATLEYLGCAARMPVAVLMASWRTPRVFGRAPFAPAAQGRPRYGDADGQHRAATAVVRIGEFGRSTD